MIEREEPHRGEGGGDKKPQKIAIYHKDHYCFKISISFGEAGQLVLPRQDALFEHSGCLKQTLVEPYKMAHYNKWTIYNK